jgi:hypothetical protein
MTWENAPGQGRMRTPEVKIVLVQAQPGLSGDGAATQHLSYHFVTGVLPTDVRAFNWASSVAFAKSRRLKQ